MKKDISALLILSMLFTAACGNDILPKPETSDGTPPPASEASPAVTETEGEPEASVGTLPPVSEVASAAIEREGKPEAPQIRGFSMFPKIETVETGVIPGTNIYAVDIKGPYDVNVYFVETGDGYIMIDTGYENTEALETGMKELNINVEDVKWILLTHTDFDHVGGLPLFPNIDIYINKNEIQHFDNDVTVVLKKRLRLPGEISIDSLTQLQDDQELLLGESVVKCIRAPGHTLGSMVYLIDDKYLFPGDTFFVLDKTVGTYPTFSENEALAKKTIEDIKKIIKDSALVLTPHHGYYKGSELQF